MALNYAWENLFKAVDYAAQHDGTLQDRLHGCYATFHVLSQKGHLPADLQPRFDEMIEAWTRMPDPSGTRGTVPVTLEQMDDEEARKWLGEIVSLYNEVTERYAIESQPASRASKA